MSIIAFLGGNGNATEESVPGTARPQNAIAPSARWYVPPGRLWPPGSTFTWRASDGVGCDCYLHMILEHQLPGVGMQVDLLMHPSEHRVSPQRVAHTFESLPVEKLVRIRLGGSCLDGIPRLQSRDLCQSRTLASGLIGPDRTAKIDWENYDRPQSAPCHTSQARSALLSGVSGGESPTIGHNLHSPFSLTTRPTLASTKRWGRRQGEREDC